MAEAPTTPDQHLRQLKVADDWANRREDLIIDAYKAGASLNKIAEHCSFTAAGVRALLKRRGIELRPPHVR